MRFYPTVVTTLGALALVAIVLAVVLALGLAHRAGRVRLLSALAGSGPIPLAAVAGLVALLATAGSLYFSEIVNLVPCQLCWYQRIAMYPLVPILVVGLARGDGGVWRYALPLSVVGLGISVYHVAIQWMPALEAAGTCGAGPPCSGRYVAVFGFISIPTMAGAAFLLISAVLLVVRAQEAAVTPPLGATAAG